MTNDAVVYPSARKLVGYHPDLLGPDKKPLTLFDSGDGDYLGGMITSVKYLDDSMMLAGRHDGSTINLVDRKPVGDKQEAPILDIDLYEGRIIALSATHGGKTWKGKIYDIETGDVIIELGGDEIMNFHDMEVGKDGIYLANKSLFRLWHEGNVLKTKKIRKKEEMRLLKSSNGVIYDLGGDGSKVTLRRTSDGEEVLDWNPGETYDSSSVGDTSFFCFTKDGIMLGNNTYVPEKRGDLYMIVMEPGDLDQLSHTDYSQRMEPKLLLKNAFEKLPENHSIFPGNPIDTVPPGVIEKVFSSKK